MDTGREVKTGQTRPELRLGSDRMIEVDGPLTSGQSLPEAFWPRVMALWGYAGSLPFFAAFRGRPVR